MWYARLAFVSGVCIMPGLIALRLYRKYLMPGLARRGDLLESRPATVVSVLLTFNFVNIGWIFFACDAVQSLYVLTRMFS